MIILKTGMELRGMAPELALGLSVAASVYSKYGVPMVITAVRNGHHKAGSLHYSGKAADLRLPSRYATRLAIDELVKAELQNNLGEQWDVLLERYPTNPDNDHIHIEFDPHTVDDAPIPT